MTFPFHQLRRRTIVHTWFVIKESYSDSPAANSPNQRVARHSGLANVDAVVEFVKVSVWRSPVARASSVASTSESTVQPPTSLAAGCIILNQCQDLLSSSPVAWHQRGEVSNQNNLQLEGNNSDSRYRFWKSTSYCGPSMQWCHLCRRCSSCPYWSLKFSFEPRCPACSCPRRIQLPEGCRISRLGFFRSIISNVRKL